MATVAEGSSRALSSIHALAAEAGPAMLAFQAGCQNRVSWANRAALDLLDVTVDDLNRMDIGVEPGPGLVVHLRPWRVQLASLLNDESSHGTVQPLGEAGALGQWRHAVVDRGNGSPVPIAMRASVGAGGETVVWLRDMTEPQQVAERAVADAEYRFRALSQHAPVGILVSEVGVRLSFVNQRFVDIAGREACSLLGTQWLDAIHPSDLPGFLESMDEVMAGSPCDITVRVVTPADGPRWVQFRLASVTTSRRSAGFIGTAEDVTARRAWEAQLTYQARHDALTGLANRRTLTEAIADILDSRRVGDRNAAVLFCDLDGFKGINDEHGHDAGDRVLIEVSQRLSAVARDRDVVSRIAGDEFVVLVNQVETDAQAEAAASRHLDALARPIHVAGRSITVSASIGIAMARDYDTAHDLLRAADRDMYAAKRAGGARHHGRSLPDRGAPASRVQAIR